MREVLIFDLHIIVFIKTTRNAAGQSYYHLVESYRDGGKVRQRTLLSLGRVEDNQLDALAQAVAKHTKLLTALDLSKQVAVDKTYVLQTSRLPSGRSWGSRRSHGGSQGGRRGLVGRRKL